MAKVEISFARSTDGDQGRHDNHILRCSGHIGDIKQVGINFELLPVQDTILFTIYVRSLVVHDIDLSINERIGSLIYTDCL
jgi:hypothetical protein